MTERLQCDLFDRMVAAAGEVPAELEAHAGGCDRCRAEIEEWRAMSARLQPLHHEWESPALLERLRRSIGEAEALSAPAREARVIPFRTILPVAAMFVLLIVGLAIVRQLASPGDATEEWIVRESAISEVEEAGRAYRASIERLAKVASTEAEAIPEPLMISYREKLMLLDQAIAECEASIEMNRYNAHLRQQLLAVYGEKERTLRAMLMEKRDEPVDAFQ